MLNHDVYEMNFKSSTKKSYHLNDMDIKAHLMGRDPSYKKIMLYDKNDRLIAEMNYTGIDKIYTHETHDCGSFGSKSIDDDVCPACKEFFDISTAGQYLLEELVKEGLVTKYYMRYDGVDKGFTKILVAK